MSIHYDIRALIAPFSLVRMLLRRTGPGRVFLQWHDGIPTLAGVLLLTAILLLGLRQWVPWIEIASGAALGFFAFLLVCEIGLSIGPYYRVRIGDSGIDTRNTLIRWGSVHAWGWADAGSKLWVLHGSSRSPAGRRWEVPKRHRSLAAEVMKQYAGEPRPFEPRARGTHTFPASRARTPAE